MDNRELYNILNSIKDNSLSVEEAMERFRYLPFEDLEYAKIDHHRGIRVGVPEVVYCEGKVPDHLSGIVRSMLERGTANILMTRMDEAAYETVKCVYEQLEYSPIARVGIIRRETIEKTESIILIATGGTADIRVAEEAALTAEVLGNTVDRLYDVGVAGIHRLLSNTDRLRRAKVVVAVAGMEGALASVIGGLVDVPVIAVPTSVGYGANFSGLSALLTMLNSCASGVSVVNIDNGFGAGYLAGMINKI